MPIGVRIFIAVEPVDLRASFYRLAAHVRGALEEDPCQGAPHETAVGAAKLIG
jgi:hypothetical protein